MKVTKRQLRKIIKETILLERTRPWDRGALIWHEDHRDPPPHKATHVVGQGSVGSANPGPRVLSHMGNKSIDASAWVPFSDRFDLGIYDLDNIAYDMGFKNFEDMHRSVSPGQLADLDPDAFVKSIQTRSAMWKYRMKTPEEMLAWEEYDGR
jgi:hypothetical protein